MFCRKCGKTIPDDSVFCSYCGEPVTVENQLEQETNANQYPYGSCGRCSKPLEQEDINGVCKNCSLDLQYEKKKTNVTAPLQSGDFYTSSPMNSKYIPKKSHGCLTAVLVCIGLFVVICIIGGVLQSTPTAANKAVSAAVESSSAPLSVRQQSILSAYDTTIKSDVEDTIKRQLKHPDTATITHDTSQLTVNNAIFTDRGSVSYTNAKGKSVKEDFTVSVIATDKVYYSLYMQLGKTVFEDSVKGVNSLGIATVYGKQIFNISDGNSVFKDADGTIILITDDERQKMSMTEYSKIETGMTYAQVTEIVGSYGEEQARTNVADYETVIIAWTGNGAIGSNANVTFQSGKVVAKAQVGLR